MRKPYLNKVIKLSFIHIPIRQKHNTRDTQLQNCKSFKDGAAGFLSFLESTLYHATKNLADKSYSDRKIIQKTRCFSRNTSCLQACVCKFAFLYLSLSEIFPRKKQTRRRLLKHINKNFGFLLFIITQPARSGNLCYILIRLSLNTHF